MKFQVDISSDNLTPQQAAQKEATYQAAKILKAAGYNVEVTRYIVTGPRQDAAGMHIVLEDHP
jgi:hypothetical protein